MRLPVLTALALCLLLAACGAPGEVSVDDVKKCLESKDYQPTTEDQSASGFGEAVIVELPNANRSSINVFKSEDDAKEKEQTLSQLVEGGGGEAKRNGNAIVSFVKPPSEGDEQKVDDCL